MKEGRRARPRNGVPLRTRLDPNVGSPRHPELFFSVNRGELSLSFLSPRAMTIGSTARVPWSRDRACAAFPLAKLSIL